MRINHRWCPCCEQEKSETEFYKGFTMQNTKKVPFCKDCCKNKFNQYNSQLGEKPALWIILAELGIPFIESIWKISVDSSYYGKKHLLEIYLGKLFSSETVYTGFWETDISFAEANGEPLKAEKIINGCEKTITQLQKTWGKYPEDEQNEAYDFLEESFSEYTKNLLDVDANLEKRYRDLCKAEYQKRKADEGGDISEIAKAQDNVTKQLKFLKLDEFKQTTQSDEDKRVERLIWMIENTRPAECEDLEVYKDFSNIEGVWGEIKRCVINLICGTKEYPDIPKDVM